MVTPRISALIYIGDTELSDRWHLPPNDPSVRAAWHDLRALDAQLWREIRSMFGVTP